MAPPILASTSAPEGVFLSNSAIGRIEVKSKLNAEGVRGFVESSATLAKLRVISTQPTEYNRAFSYLFAFHTDHNAEEGARNDFELRRVLVLLKVPGNRHV
jgi:hypothetical protein